MTVSTTTNKIAYIGNGIANSFAVPFSFLKTQHLKVYQKMNGVRTERTDWTLSGGNMVFETVPASGAQIVIVREVPMTQETDYRENEILAAETLERNFDKLTMITQQLNEESARAVKVDIFSNTDPSAFAAEIEALYAIRDDIVTDSQNISSISAVAGNATNINAVNANKTNINTAAGNNTNITTVATNISAVNTAATNISAIQAAPTQAANAAASATLAQQWATKTDGKVENTDYSARWYSFYSRTWAISTTVVEDGNYGAKYYALQAGDANTSAQTAKTKAQEWASKTDGAVESGEYSAKYYAELARSLTLNPVTLDTTQTITGIKTFNASFSLNNTVVAGPGIKFAASGVEKADLFWRDGYGFTMTTANGAAYELLRIKDPLSTDKGPYAATTSWCRDSTLGAPDYSGATEFVNQSNYTTNLPYAAPKNGWIDLTVAAGSMITAAVNGRNVGGVTGNDGTYPAHILYRVKKGDVITRVNSSGTWGISFIPNANV